MKRGNNNYSFSDFFLVGISHKNTPTSVRSLFAVHKEAYPALPAYMADYSVSECFILSTCNRTEIYGHAESPQSLVRFLCTVTSGDYPTFMEHAYTLQGDAAVAHLFRVTCGVESQIIGDYEITAQVKHAAQWCKSNGLLGTNTERMVNAALHVSKAVKNGTKFSSGIVSVSFASVRLLEKVEHIHQKSILLIGAGKIGKNTCKSLQSYLGHRDITIMNRTESVARIFAEQQGLRMAKFSDLKRELNRAEIVIVATNAPQPIINRASADWKGQIVIDFSIPNNVDRGLDGYRQVKLLDVDALSQIPDTTLSVRQSELSKVNAIIADGVTEFALWHKRSEQARILSAIKDRMKEIQKNEIKNFKKHPQMDMEGITDLTSKMIQKFINIFGGKLMNEDRDTASYAKMLQEIFAGNNEEIMCGN